MEIHLPAVRSLKAKRSVVRHLVEASRHRFGVSASEVAHHDRWQRAELLLEQVERFVWSHPEIEVIAADRHWVDTGDIAR
jgi:hypothetical protein